MLPNNKMDSATITLIITQVSTLVILIIKELLAYYDPSAVGIVNGILSAISPTPSPITSTATIVEVVPKNKN